MTSIRFLDEFGGSFVVLALFPFLLLGLAIPYAILSLRNVQNEDTDQQIGLKSCLYFIFSLSILLVLTGMTVIVVDFMMEDRLTGSSRKIADFNEAQRNGTALMVSGFVIGLFHLTSIIAFTNDRRFPATRRVFVGWRLAIHSLVVLAAFTVMMVQIFSVNVKWDSLKVPFGILLVWAPSWLIHLLLLNLYGGAVVPRFQRPVMLRREEE